MIRDNFGEGVASREAKLDAGLIFADAVYAAARRPENQEFTAASPGASRHLLQLARLQRAPAVISTRVGIANHDGAGGEVDAGRDGRRCEDGVQQAGRHHLLDEKLPRRNMSGMV